ncbi:methyl-accepting chemotaxis protein [Kitasatospora sp. GAS204A]|uniref:type VII secretion target n=1 Tax=unclassified Kitasatospora TaxID=2633591 RepID=UPI002475EE2A|nr:type VII secretion target [Kitasatospora sp. GAS204B]MDH6118694.1 methyl-accepting chemotaxis protein [Kitasatospora sp. GAS204B]
MAGSHFSIQPDKVSALGADFHSSADTLGGQIGTFESKAENVNDAFGVLSESTAVLQQYVAMTQATVTSLRQLQTQLQQYSAGLDQTAANYRKTDQHHAKKLRGA